MKRNDQSQGNAELHETDLLISEVDNLIVSAEERIEQQRKYVRAGALDFERSMKAISKLDAMMVALDKLKTYRERIVDECNAG